MGTFQPANWKHCGGTGEHQMKNAVLMPEGFDSYLNIQNARERLEEARDISTRLWEGGIALKANADHYAIFSDPPRLVAGPLKQVGYVVGADNRCYPSPVDGCDYINVAASLPALSAAREKGWPDHVAIVHPVDGSAHGRMIEQGYGNPFIHHITWGIPLPSSVSAEDPAGSLISRMVEIRETISGLLNETPGTLIIAMPREVVQGDGFQEQFNRSIGSTPEEQYQLEVMEGGGYLLQFFVLKGGRIEVALRSGTNQTFNPKSVQKISRDELSVDQGHSASTTRM
jgi:hypothetical protein